LTHPKNMVLKQFSYSIKMFVRATCLYEIDL
jgi:hypothetical protein